VVDDHVLLADRRKAIAAMLANALGKARRIGRELEVGPVDAHQLLQVVDAQHSGNDVDVPIGQVERALHHAPQRVRHARLNLEADHQPTAAALQRPFEEADKVFRLFLHLDVGVADQPERALAADLIAGEQARHEQADRVFQHDEAQGGRTVPLARQLDEALQAAGTRISACMARLSRAVS
jgi:hypothetical protein